ncbi:hypothetical protein CDD82_2299 [Ophiocordyceps australis]|uniref:Uncharacterized protein n=1 Tax=Ophiocordyceps australis TaxID=1399860 RepID=A0A2C5X7Y8_9HYPO|nr:hypothetical protein CDD82_2299 [Ophiocordyceps australis]
MPIPREGFTVDLVVAVIKRVLLNPKLTLPAAGLVWWQPLYIRLLTRLGAQQASGVRSRVTLLAGVSVVLAVARHVKRLKANNWTQDKTWDWDHEIVVVTGGSSGIGERMTQQLLARNAKTRIAVVDFKPLTWTPPEADVASGRLRVYQCDVGDAAALRETCRSIRQDLGDPTVLFNNAGLVRGRTIVDSSPGDIEATVRTNLIAPMLLANEFLPAMIRRDHGHIVNTGSLASVMSVPRLVDYAATKAGLTSLHEGLQLELARCHKAPRVRLTLGVFSYIQTPLFSGDLNLSSFFSPLLHVDSVAERLVDAVYSGYGSTIYMPSFVALTVAMKGAPDLLYWPLRQVACRSQLDFTGRQQVDELTGALR